MRGLCKLASEKEVLFTLFGVSRGRAGGAPFPTPYRTDKRSLIIPLQDVNAEELDLFFRG